MNESIDVIILRTPKFLAQVAVFSIASAVYSDGLAFLWLLAISCLEKSLLKSHRGEWQL
jgi:hypothetical protein